MTYKRAHQKVRPHFVETAAGQLICKKPCKIIIPARWTDVNLAEIGISTFAYGFFPIILEDTNEYMLSNVPVKLELNPYQIKPLKIDDVEHIEFSFEPNTPVIVNTTVVMKRTFIYDILSELLLKGKIPWYATYKDIATIFRLAKKYAGSDAANVDAVTEHIASIVARSAKSMKTYLRTALPNVPDADTDDILFVPLSSVVHSVNNTVNKLTGAYFSDGIQSALVHPSKQTEKIESILRA